MDFEDNIHEIEENDDGPPNEQDNPENAEEAAASGDEDAAAAIVPKPKKVVRHPRLKFNEETLKSQRGLSALPSYFERVKFKGKGHEEEDLNVIMKTYEYWFHRLFPKYPFDECIAKTETLGHKRPVITHIKKIRMDLDVDEAAPALPTNPDSSDDDNDDRGSNHSFQMREGMDQPAMEITEQQEELIRLNKAKAEKLRQEKLLKRSQEQSSAILTALDSQGSISSQPQSVESTAHLTQTWASDSRDSQPEHEEVTEDATNRANDDEMDNLSSSIDHATNSITPGKVRFNILNNENFDTDDSS